MGCLMYSMESKGETHTPNLVEVSPSAVFIPTGFDDNDNSVQVVIEGFFPNTCYKIAPAFIDKSRIDLGKIHIIPRAYFYKGACLQAMIRYEQTIDLGILSARHYDIAIADETVSHSLFVKHAANSGPDDYLYAPVQEAKMISLRKPSLKLKGNFPNTCFSIDPKDTMIDVTNQVVVILPIAQYDGTRGCIEMLKPFDITVPIEKKLDGRYLIHIRSLEGQSKNLIENF